MRHLRAPMAAKNTLWMCVALAAAILAAFLVVVLGTPTKRAEAAFPGRNGKIAFTCYDGDDQEICTINANGDNKTQLTNNGVDDEDPAFSANGKKIAFRSGGNLGDIFTMSANGTDKKRVTTGTSPVRNPAWSPDGTKIAFSRGSIYASDIFVINQDGSGLRGLITSRPNDFDPAWSPDGTRIAFQRGNGESKIFVMKAAPESQTNIPQRLTTSGSGVREYTPAWSPNGIRIAFLSGSGATTSDFELYTIRADGSGQNQLTNSDNAFNSDPAWSPDGTKIAFRGRRGTARTLGIYVMKAAPESATNRPKRITTGVGPDWQPLP